MNPPQNNTCGEVAPLLVFYVCDEVNDQERAAIDAHVTACAVCRAQLKDEQKFHAAFSSLPRSGEQLDSTGILLSQCRSELAEALDDLHHPPVKEKASRFGFLRHWMALHPAWSAATLVLLGLVAGTESTQWFTGQRNAAAVDQAVNIRPARRFTEDQLAKMAVAGVNITPSPQPGSKNVRVLLSAEEPVELTGNIDDSDVRDVLTYVVKSGERFDSGLRLDCMDALRVRTENDEVRSAFLSAARRDPNPAVRLKALEALRNSASDGQVREVLLQSLRHDSNPGVRVEAVNLLVRSLEQQPDMGSMPQTLPELSMSNMMQAGAPVPTADGSLDSVIRALTDLQRNDPSRYVRLRSASALRQINVRNDQ
jgi:HEAT repeats